jgi:hypothetical protein
MIRYISDLAALLGLDGWTIVLSDDPADDGSYADIQVVYGQRCATIRVAPEWRTWPPELLRSTIVHELFHCHLEPVCELASDLFDTMTKKPAPANAAVHYLIERTVDVLAESIAPYLPLPDGTL